MKFYENFNKNKSNDGKNYINSNQKLSNAFTWGNTIGACNL